MAASERNKPLTLEEAQAIIEMSPDFMVPREAGYTYGISTKALRGLGSHMLLPESPHVLYPGSSVDTGVAEVFGRENVTHLDSHIEAMAVMAEAGYLAVPGGASLYDGQPADLVVVRSAPIVDEDLVAGLIQPSGYLISNALGGGIKGLVQEGRLALIAAHPDSDSGELFDKPTAEALLDEGLQSQGNFYSENLVLYQRQD